MHRRPLPALALLFFPLLAACGGGSGAAAPPAASPEEDLKYTVETVTAEAAKLDEAGLRAALAAYERALEEARGELDAAKGRAGEVPKSDLLATSGSLVVREAELLRNRLKALEYRQQVYERELARRQR